MASPRWLHRAFTPSSNSGSCGVCESALLAGGELAFFAAFSRNSGGSPVFTAVSQFETRGNAAARVSRRPDDCTCTNAMLHSKGRRAYRGSRSQPPCEIYEPCSCGIRERRGAKAHPSLHSQDCAQRIQFVTRDGVWAGMVHVSCASAQGCATPTAPGGPGVVQRRIRGSRSVGRENRPGAGTSAVAPAPVRAPVTPAPTTRVCGRGWTGWRSGQRETCHLPNGHPGACVAAAREIAPQASAEDALAGLGGTVVAAAPSAPIVETSEEPGVMRFRNLDLDLDEETPSSDGDDDIFGSIDRFRNLDLD